MRRRKRPENTQIDEEPLLTFSEVPANFGEIPCGAHNFGKIPDSGIRRSLHSVQFS